MQPLSWKFRVKHSGPLFTEGKSLRESKPGSGNISPDRKITRLYILLREELLLLLKWQMCALEFKLLWTISQTFHVLLNWHLWDVYEGHSHALVIKESSTSFATTCLIQFASDTLSGSFARNYEVITKSQKLTSLITDMSSPSCHMTQIWSVLIWNICIWSFQLLSHCFSVADLGCWRKPSL